MWNCRCTFCGFALHIATLSGSLKFSGMLRRRMLLMYLRYTSLLLSFSINLIFEQQCWWVTTQLSVNYPVSEISWHISYHIISYHIISYHIISYHIISYHIIYHIISYHIIYHIISYHIYHIISYRIISYIIYIYHIISYIILYHIIYFPSVDLYRITQSIWIWKSSYLLGVRSDINTSVYNSMIKKIGQYELFSVIKHNKDKNKN